MSANEWPLEADTTDGDGLDPHGNRFPGEMRDLAYQLWAYKCDRSIPCTMRELARECPDEGLPVERTLRRWARGWDERVAADLATIAPALNARQLGRLFVMSEQALDTMSATLRGEYDGLRGSAIMARVQTAFKVLELRGLGTAGTKAEAPAIPQAQLREGEMAGMSPQELARRQREMLLEDRE